MDTDGDGVCDALEIVGCQDATACNYDSTSTNEGVCTYAEAYYNCNGECLADDNIDGVCNENEVYGCTATSACNYDETTTEDDGSCIYADEYFDCNGSCLMDTDGDGICDALEVLGCTDTSACSYDETATDNDNELCTYIAYHYIPLDLPQGWSMFGYTCTEAIDVIDGFTLIVDEIYLVKDENALVYWPEFQFNNLDSLRHSEGYQIKMLEQIDDFQFCPTLMYNDDCEEFIPEFIPLDLPQGWSMFGYTCTEAIDVIEGFALIEDEIYIVKDENALVYWPEFQFNNLDSLRYSEGYQVNMLEQIVDFQFCPTFIGE
jgi:hypothetical protein